uniref:Thymus, brain and testes associated n=1 Tax=Sphaeramia orbicularis TaxID=375764 RepID=A0A672YUL0_9TELE
QGVNGRPPTVHTHHCFLFNFPATPGGLNVEFKKMLPKSSPRFGALSHHSFFSRHNPHPHRVRHIQGLNGRPVCSVRDDWYVTSSLFPHPLLKSHIHKRGTDPSSTLPLAQSLYGATAQKDKKEIIRCKTQYSAQTGRIIPPSSKSHQFAFSEHWFTLKSVFFRQVLEVLCQILQTDSLSTVQQWLLLAGQRGMCTMSIMK